MCAQPIINPALPFVGAIPGGLQPGRMIRVSGVAHPTARCFSINLQCGPGSTSQDDIALHLSPVFSPPPRLVRNSLQNQQWGPEESHGPYFPFVVGQHFEILILTEGDEYKIAVNGQHFCEFKHRIPIYRVTSLSVNGDATINEIKYEGTISPLGGMQQPSTGGFSGGFLPPPGMPTATSPSCPPAYSVPNPPSPTPYGQQPYPTQSGLPYQPNPYGAPPLPPGSNPYGTPPVPPGSNPYGTSPYGMPQGNYPQASKSGGLGSLLPSGLAAGIGALAGSTLLGKGMKHGGYPGYPYGKPKSSSPIPIGLAAGAGALAGAAMLGKSPLKIGKKMKKLYKHKGFKHKGFKHKGWHMGGWHSSSSSSSSEEE